MKQAPQPSRAAAANSETAQQPGDQSVDPARLRARANQFAKEIVAQEGGVADRPADQDPGGRTRYGITHDTYVNWSLRHKLDGRPPIPLRFEQVDANTAARILREVVYDDRNLDRIEDDRLAHQLMDILSNTSPEGAFPFIQRAVDEVMRKHDLYNEQTKPIGLDQPVGPLTMARMNWIVRVGYGSDLKNALGERRLAAARKQPHFKHNPGWVARFRRFLEPVRDL